jgi:hypothetical protein
MLIAGGSFVAGSDNPHHGTSMPLGPSTPSVAEQWTVFQTSTALESRLRQLALFITSS